MDTIFSSDFFKGNRQRLRELLDNQTPVVLTAHGLLQRSGDNTFPFHQESNFWYLTGIEEPDIVLVMDGNDEYMIVPGRSASREAFDGAVDAAELTKRSGIMEIVAEEDGWKRLGARLKDTTRVQTLAAPLIYIEQYGLYTNPARGRLVERLKTWRHDIEIVDIRDQLTGMRMVKQTEELQAIRAAIDVTLDGIRFVAAGERLGEYEYEFEIESDLTKKFRTKQSSGHSFAPIVASGKRGVSLHNVSNSGKLGAGELVVIDVGAEVEHYAADVTRTVVNGQPTERQQAVFDAVLDVQRYALELLKPGAILKDYEGEVEKFMGTKLQELGLVDEATREAVRTYYPHATSHFLGLDVHDTGDYDRPLEAGMVLTCEPGIYIPEESIGVRIEDDVLITESGNEVLSEALPKTLML